MARWLLPALLLLLLLLLALALAAAGAGPALAALGGAARARPRSGPARPPRPPRSGPARPPRPPRAGPARPDPRLSPHLIVDTLNLTHALAPPGFAMSPAAIVATIDATAARLRARHPGEVVYVLKDRSSEFDSAESRALYQAAAARNRVTVVIASRYRDPPRGVPPSAEHSAAGRDDAYMALLAQARRCAVLTRDRFNDFARFRATVQPFYTVEYTPWRALPRHQQVMLSAAAFARLRRPPTVDPSAYFAECPAEPGRDREN